MAEVTDTKKTDGVFLHLCRVESGTLRVGDSVSAEINEARRAAIARNHSACHLLQAALREVLGNHVEQAGSYVNDEYFRFDFSHYAPVSAEELSKVEAIVNENVLAADEGSMTEMPIEEAKKLGALALFGEKYGKTVRVVRMGASSVEFCGGTHVNNTAKIGLFKIISESSVAAGIRRIEGTTGYGVLGMIAKKDALIAETAKVLKVANAAELARRAAQLENELKQARRELESANAKLSSAKLAGIIDSAKQVGAYKLLTARMDNMQVDAARTLCDSIKAEHPDMVAVLALVNDGKLNFVACCGANAVKAGAHAGNILRSVSAICGGRGGGRPDSAMSGGSDLAKIEEALASVAALLA